MKVFRNTDPDRVLNSKYFSTYKGVLVIRHSMKKFTSCALPGLIFLNRKAGRDTLDHEYGHTRQAKLLGTLRYWVYIAVPSLRGFKNKVEDYYSQPWEKTADVLGGVERGSYLPGAAEEGNKYLREVKEKKLGEVLKQIWKDVFSRKEEV